MMVWEDSCKCPSDGKQKWHHLVARLIKSPICDIHLQPMHLGSSLKKCAFFMGSFCLYVFRGRNAQANLSLIQIGKESWMRSTGPEARIGSICFIAKTFPFRLYQTEPFSSANKTCRPVF